MSSLPQVGGGGGEAQSPSSLLETLRKRQQARAAGETQPVTTILEGLEQVVIAQTELLERQERQLQQQEEETKARVSAIQKKAKTDRDDLIEKIKEFTGAMDLQLQNLARKLSASRGDNKVLDERQRSLITNIDLMKEQLDLLTQEVIGE
jgi:hypothetical protein